VVCGLELIEEEPFYIDIEDGFEYLSYFYAWINLCSFGSKYGNSIEKY
jgi:hypothetical protein